MSCSQIKLSCGSMVSLACAFITAYIKYRLVIYIYIYIYIIYIYIYAIGVATIGPGRVMVPEEYNYRCGNIKNCRM